MLKSFPHKPSLLHKFDNDIVQMEIGGASGYFLDNKGSIYSIGENNWVINNKSFQSKNKLI